MPALTTPSQWHKALLQANALGCKRGGWTVVTSTSQPMNRAVFPSCLILITLLINVLTLLSSYKRFSYVRVRTEKPNSFKITHQTT